MAIDFSQIGSGDDFELLCRDVLKSKGVTILSNPAVGPDQGKDILIEVESEDELGTKEKHKYVVQCKHFAKSGKSVQAIDLGDIRSVCDKYDAQGYFLIASTMPSVTVATNFEGINKKGDYKCIFWDKKELESQIEKLSDSVTIISRYNLKNDFDNISSFVKRILTSESKLPLDYYKSIEDDAIKGFIYKQEKPKTTGTVQYEFLGYFCIDYSVDEKEVSRLKSLYALSELHIITSDENKSNFSMSLNDFYLHIQSYKDHWYQLAIVKLVGFSPINPTVIHIINSAITSLPYPVQEPVINFLDSLLDVVASTTKRFDEFVVIEACAAIAKLNIQSLKPNILRVLTLIPSIKENFTGDEVALMHLSTMTGRIISSLIDLEMKKIEYKENIIELFNITVDLDYKMSLIAYLKEFDIHDVDDAIRELQELYGSYSLNPPYNGIIHSPQGVSLMKNQASFTVDRVVDDYFGRTDNNYGALISYNGF